MSSFLQSGRPPLILASGSKSRARVLEAAGLAFIVEPPGLDEAVMRQAVGGKGSLSPHDVAEVLARAKAEAVSDLAPKAYVIGGDQVLALGDTIFSKPDSMEAARRQLLDLSGKTHTLHTAVAVATDGETHLGGDDDCHAHHAQALAGVHRPLPRRRRRGGARLGRGLSARSRSACSCSRKSTATISPFSGSLLFRSSIRSGARA